jgi:hypothetical protein
MLRRERRALLRVREERIRDLGGLMLEMFRRDQFREDLLREHCEELLGLESRLEELDALLTSGQQVSSGRCTCGAPVLWGAHFCANCGRPAGNEPVVACAKCGTPLPADVRFCSACGAATERASDEPQAEEPGEDASPSEEDAGPEARAAGEPKPDPWER